MSISEIDENELPKGWTKASLADIADVITGSTPSTSILEYYGGDIPFIKPPHLNNAPIAYTEQTISEIGKSSARIVPPNTTLVSCIGILGKVGITIIDSAFNQQINAVVFSKVVEPRFGFYACQLLRPFLENQASGTTVPIVNKSKFAIACILIAPLNEQKRIVAKIEELFSKLDAGIVALERVQANLKRYRAAVLKAAVEGKLTEEWRKQNPNTEPASKLLQRILKERRQKWESEQLEKYQKSGKTPPKDWQSKYKEPSALDTHDLPELPKGWLWVTLDTLATVKGGITVDSKRNVSNTRSVPYLRVANVQRGYLNLSEIKTIEATEDVINNLKLEYGDLLFNEGGDRDKLGRGWIWRNEIPECIHQNHVFRGRLYLKEVLPQIISWCTNSYGKDWFITHGKQTTNLASISLTMLNSFPVPLMPVSEQKILVQQVDYLLSDINELEKIAEINILRASRLRQSILKQAFSGKLVPQDPNDEPASLLLQRIQAEKANTIKAKPTKRQRQKVNDEN